MKSFYAQKLGNHFFYAFLGNNTNFETDIFDP